MIFYVSCVLLLAAFCLYRWRRYRFSLFKELGIPGPEPSLSSGNLSELTKKGEVAAFEEWIPKYGDIMGFYNGATPILIVKDLDLIKKILIQDFSNFHDRGIVSKFARAHQLSNLSLLNASGDRWKDMRRILIPAFASSKVKKLTSLMNQCCDDFLDVLSSLHGDENTLEIRDFFRKLALDIMLGSSFGIQSNAQKTGQMMGVNLIGTELINHLNFLVNGWESYLVECFPELTFLWKSVFWFKRHFMKLPINKINELLMPIINIRRSQPSPVDQDLLQLMLNAEAEDDRATNTHTRKEDNDNTRYMDNETRLRKKRLLTNAEIQSNVFTFLVDGVETASTAMTFMAYLLAKHSDIQDKVRSEVFATLEKDGEFNSGNITSLRYMDQVISEALRVFPPITGFVTRTCEKDYDWNGLKIPAGMSIKIPVYQLHHDRNLWHEPEKFNPERFSDDNRGNIVPMAYQAYGNGPHNCIGMRFAQVELKLTLAKLLANYKLLLDEKRMKENPFELDSSSIFCYPRNGVWLKLQKISSVL
ncbi:unnamed protein product [Ixodes pacificus]